MGEVRVAVDRLRATHGGFSQEEDNAPPARLSLPCSTASDSEVDVLSPTRRLSIFETGSNDSSTTIARPHTPVQPARFLRVASLNLGGRNTNPLEFELKGDSLEAAVEAASILNRARKSLTSARDGPLRMPGSERTLVFSILAEIFDGPGDLESHPYMKGLFQHATWSQVLAEVKTHQPHLFNALNLSTLKLRRPSVWEDPHSCREFSNTLQYLTAWQAWYRGLDRQSRFWLQDAPRSAKKRKLDVPTCFAGLLLFDVMSLCTAHGAMGSTLECSPPDDTREVPFNQIAKFGSRLPASSFKARHAVAEKFVHGLGAHVLFAQEARDFANHPRISEDFLPPICAEDGFTCVFLRKDVFAEVMDISADVAGKMEGFLDSLPDEQSQKAWRTNTCRLAAACCTAHPQYGGMTLCLLSLHCSHSDVTGPYIEALRGVLGQYETDLNIVGMDSNCSGKESAAFQQRLWHAGFEIGCQLKGQDQVTVVKQRTFFQTQVRKAGETDISHKDYILSWGSTSYRRGETSHKPDLRTVYGVEQETKRCVRLPTIRWPFDHCAVVSDFYPRQNNLRAAFCSGPCGYASAAVMFIFLVLLLPLASSPVRASPYGPTGTWHRQIWLGRPHVGICEAVAGDGGGCPHQGWIRGAGGCYLVTSEKMGLGDAEIFCEEAGGSLVSIGSEAENEFISGMVCPRGEFCWIGLRGGTWASGEALNYTRLVEQTQGFLPLFPSSQDRSAEAAVLSALEGQTCGCAGGDLLASDLAIPALLGAIVVLVISFLLLILPRPRNPLTSLYLAMSFFGSLVEFLLTATTLCFVQDARMLQAMQRASQPFNTFSHVLTPLLAIWIILRRVGLLCPTAAEKTVYMFLTASMVSWLILCTLFIDVAAPMTVASLSVVAFLSVASGIILLYLLLCVLMAKDLYQVCAIMTREATSGCSNKSAATLRRELRVVQAHFLCVVSAIFSGALFWSAMLAQWLLGTEATYSTIVVHITYFFSIFHTVATDVCAYLLAVLKIDEAIVRGGKGITSEIAERAAQEVEQHHLAVRMLKAAPTSQEQLLHFAELECSARKATLESQAAAEPFLVFQSAIKVESARIHRLMHCVRTRAMTMPLRYQYLIDIPPLPGYPKQYVPGVFRKKEPTPAVARDYFNWLYSEMDGAQQMLFYHVHKLLAKFNRTPWPSDLGLVREQYPWMIWANSPGYMTTLCSQHRPETISPGDILVYKGSPCFVLEEYESTIRIHRSGMETAEEVAREELRTCSGGGVFIPGPKKKKQRCLDKISADYEGQEEWPAATNLLDISRCMVLFDDPYALAVFVAYVRENLQVVRVKNRFSEDVLERATPEDLQAMFYSAADLPDTCSDGASARAQTAEHQYRDVSINVIIASLQGAPLVGEIQVTLSDLAVLKHADTKLYAIRRMKSAEELQMVHVFS